jgi:enoyl-CoA hydratase
MDTLNVDRVGNVVRVQLARPPVNAVNRQMMDELRECFDSISIDRTVGAVVFAAEGDRAFCGGIDLKERRAERQPQAVPVAPAAIDPGKQWRDTQHAVRHCAVPVVAAVRAPAIGAGFGIVSCSDIILAAPGATFGLTEINVGLLGGASKAIRMVGPYKARHMLFTGELASAEELYRLGAVESIIDATEVEAHALALATELGQKSPVAMRLAKESILRIEGTSVEDSYRTEQDYTERLKSYPDSREAMTAFVERRPPRWEWS